MYLCLLASGELTPQSRIRTSPVFAYRGDARTTDNAIQPQEPRTCGLWLIDCVRLWLHYAGRSGGFAGLFATAQEGGSGEGQSGEKGDRAGFGNGRRGRCELGTKQRIKTTTKEVV